MTAIPLMTEQDRAAIEGGGLPAGLQPPPGAAQPAPVAAPAGGPPMAAPAPSVAPPAAPVAALPPAGPPATVAPADPAQAAAAEAAALPALQAEEKAARTSLVLEEVGAKADLAAEKDREAGELVALQGRQALARERAQGEVNLRRQKAETEPFTTLAGTRSIGQKILTAVGLLLGGVDWNSNHINRAAETLADAEKEYDALQQQKHARLYKDLQLAIDGQKDLSSLQLREAADLSAKHAAFYDAVAKRAEVAMASAQGRVDLAELERVQAEFRGKANKSWQDALTARATAHHVEAETKLTGEQAKTQGSVRARNYAEANSLNSLANQDGGALSKIAAAADAGASQAQLLKIAELMKVPKAVDVVTKIKNDADERKKLMVFGPNGERFEAPSPQSAESYRKLEPQLKQAEGALKELEENYQTYGMEVPVTKGGRERAGIMKRLVLSMKTVGDLGALAGPDMDLVTDIGGGRIGNLLGDDVGLKNMRQLVDKARITARAAIGAPPAIPNGAPASNAPPAPSAGAPSGVRKRITLPSTKETGYLEADGVTFTPD